MAEKDSSSPVAAFIRKARETLRLNQDAFGESYGVKKANVSSWENGRHLPPIFVVAHLAERLGVEIPIEVSTIYLGGSAMPDGAITVRSGKIVGIAVVGRGSGGEMPERVWNDSDHPSGETGEYADVASQDPQAFIAEVVNNSMYPKYIHGGFALVEPNTAIDIEDDVLVRLADGQTLLKRLASRRNGITLASYNEPGTLFFKNEEISWMYYVAYPVPRKKIKNRV